MLSRSSSVAKTLFTKSRGAALRSFASEATEAADAVSLNLSVPYESIYKGAKVESVIIPGTEGEYGVSANHVPYVAQMKPGVLTVMFDSTESEKYFVAGGYAVTHANSVTVSGEEKNERTNESSAQTPNHLWRVLLSVRDICMERNSGQNLWQKDSLNLLFFSLCFC